MVSFNNFSLKAHIFHPPRTMGGCGRDHPCITAGGEVALRVGVSCHGPPTIGSSNNHYNSIEINQTTTISYSHLTSKSKKTTKNRFPHTGKNQLRTFSPTSLDLSFQCPWDSHRSNQRETASRRRDERPPSRSSRRWRRCLWVWIIIVKNLPSLKLTFSLIDWIYISLKKYPWNLVGAVDGTFIFCFFFAAKFVKKNPARMQNG